MVNSNFKGAQKQALMKKAMKHNRWLAKLEPLDKTNEKELFGAHDVDFDSA